MSINRVLYPDSDLEGYQKKWRGDPNKSITGSGFAVPRGLESVLSYNGIVLNDLSVYDKYRVTGIDGLADADVRDNREEKSGDDGDDAFKSLYAGRTIVLSIRVEAYSLDKLRDMEEALRTAFADLTEKPLYFLTGDSEKDHYIMCKKSSSNSKDEDVSSLDYRHFRDWQITLRASDPRFYRAKEKFISSIINSESIGNLNTASRFEDPSNINKYKVTTNSNSLTSGISSDWSIPAGGKSLKIETNDTADTTISTIDLVPMISGYSLEATADINVILDIPSVWVAYLSIYFLDYYGAKIKSESSKSTIILGEPLTMSGKLYCSSIVPEGAAKMQLAIDLVSVVPDGVGKNTTYIDNINAIYDNSLNIQTGRQRVYNIGNYNSEPIITLFGGLKNICLHNENAPKPHDTIKFKSSVEIPEDDFYIIDIKNKTIKNKFGQNKLSDLDKTSGWLKLYPGINNISLDSSTIMEDEAKITFRWKDAWI